MMKPVQRKIEILLVSKGSVINQFKLGLPLPYYCGISWDSFEECFLDYLEAHVSGIKVVHKGEIGLSKEDKDAYFGILRDAMKSHKVVVASQ